MTFSVISTDPDWPEGIDRTLAVYPDLPSAQTGMHAAVAADIATITTGAPAGQDRLSVLIAYGVRDDTDPTGPCLDLLATHTGPA